LINFEIESETTSENVRKKKSIFIAKNTSHANFFVVSKNNEREREKGGKIYGKYCKFHANPAKLTGLKS
jgi:hypothetical protein